MGGIQEAAERGFLARRHDGERAQDPVGRPGEPIGRVDPLREDGLDLRSGLLTGSLHGGRSLALRSSTTEECHYEEESRDRDRESPKTRRRANTARPSVQAAERVLGLDDLHPVVHRFFLNSLILSWVWNSQ